MFLVFSPHRASNILSMFLQLNRQCKNSCKCKELTIRGWVCLGRFYGSMFFLNKILLTNEKSVLGNVSLNNTRCFVLLRKIQIHWKISAHFILQEPKPCAKHNNLAKHNKPRKVLWDVSKVRGRMVGESHLCSTWAGSNNIQPTVRER